MSRSILLCFIHGFKVCDMAKDYYHEDCLILTYLIAIRATMTVSRLFPRYMKSVKSKT